MTSVNTRNMIYQLKVGLSYVNSAFPIIENKLAGKYSELCFKNNLIPQKSVVNILNFFRIEGNKVIQKEIEEGKEIPLSVHLDDVSESQKTQVLKALDQFDLPYLDICMDTLSLKNAELLLEIVKKRPGIEVNISISKIGSETKYLVEGLKNTRSKATVSGQVVNP